MPKLKTHTPRELDRYLSRRPGEIKLGEKIQFLDKNERLKDSSANFVLLGIPEDIGVRANYGKPGTSGAWQETLKALLNVQHNEFQPSEKLLLLGEIDCSQEMQKAYNLDQGDPNYFQKMGELVEEIDAVVSGTVEGIIEAGKIPIVIGGGHNNAFGNIKGASQALHKSLNVLNIDAHTDLRQLEHRHSGNGFSYARDRGYLKNYGIFGLHQNYTPQYIFEEMKATPNIEFVLYEHLTDLNRVTTFLQLLDDLSTDHFGLEVDCDAVAGFPSSALSPTGFTLNQLRELVTTAAEKENCTYLHLCEAAPTEGYPTGKALAYLITDFIKARNI